MKIEDIERAAEVKRQLMWIDAGIDLDITEKINSLFGSSEQESADFKSDLDDVVDRFLHELRIAREDELTEMGIE